MDYYYCIQPSPLGNLYLLANGNGLRALSWEEKSLRNIPVSALKENSHHPILRQTIEQLNEYFTGKRYHFTIPLEPVGTPFQLQVWQSLMQVPYGETRSYSQQAMMLNKAKATRAVGSANSKNPLAIVVPCHRIIGKNGKLTGFNGGLDAKAKLLELEALFLKHSKR